MSEPTTTPPDLDTILANWRGKARVLDSTGHTNDAALLDAFADEVTAATEDYRRFISLPDAKLRSGRGDDYLRGLFRALALEGHAHVKGRTLYFRACCVPRRPDVAAARMAGLRGGERQAS